MEGETMSDDLFVEDEFVEGLYDGRPYDDFSFEGASEGFVARGDRGTEVRELQRLLNLEGLPVRVDGVFGRETEAVVRRFQRSRGLSADGRAGPDTWAALAGPGVAPAGRSEPMPVPPGDPVPFASAPPLGSSWPVRTGVSPSRREVSHRTVGGPIIGSSGRMFLANRTASRTCHNGRWQVGIDLLAVPDTPVVACEDGRVVNLHPFLTSRAGEPTMALLVEHPAAVINYGEVRRSLLPGVSVGATVRAGQTIARVSSTRMLHFETYRRGTRASARWCKDRARPANLLNPTRYLLFLRINGL
jgi:murein DD-endopeptidase MepM/ murein hydrolase activator NlpD